MPIPSPNDHNSKYRRNNVRSDGNYSSLLWLCFWLFYGSYVSDQQDQKDDPPMLTSVFASAPSKPTPSSADIPVDGKLGNNRLLGIYRKDDLPFLLFALGELTSISLWSLCETPEVLRSLGSGAQSGLLSMSPFVCLISANRTNYFLEQKPNSKKLERHTSQSPMLAKSISCPKTWGRS